MYGWLVPCVPSTPSRQVKYIIIGMESWTVRFLGMSRSHQGGGVV
jgi:hypothetical protein